MSALSSYDWPVFMSRCLRDPGVGVGVGAACICTDELEFVLGCVVQQTPRASRCLFVLAAAPLRVALFGPRPRWNCQQAFVDDALRVVADTVPDALVVAAGCLQTVVDAESVRALSHPPVEVIFHRRVVATFH